MLPIHNPEPSTPRGKRRHANRSESDKNRAVKAWKTPRSARSTQAALDHLKSKG